MMIDFALIKVAVVLIAFLLAIFLFWRNGRHELFESSFLFDFLIVSFLGGLMIARVFDFFLFSDIYHWSIKRLLFFNIYGSFNWWGVLLGAIISGKIYLKFQKVNFWQIFDIAAAPIVFAALLISLGSLVDNLLSKSEISFHLYYFIGYFLIFWILKRLARRKRHFGFFSCFFIISVSGLNLLLLSFKERPVKTMMVVPYELLIAGTFLFFGMVTWYLLAKRDLFRDLKMIFALDLLIILKIKRIVTSVREADSFSRSILLLPFYLAKSILLLVKLVGRQIAFSLWDLVGAFRGRK